MPSAGPESEASPEDEGETITAAEVAEGAEPLISVAAPYLPKVSGTPIHDVSLNKACLSAEVPQWAASVFGHPEATPPSPAAAA